MTRILIVVLAATALMGCTPYHHHAIHITTVCRCHEDRPECRQDVDKDDRDPDARRGGRGGKDDRPTGKKKGGKKGDSDGDHPGTTHRGGRPHSHR